MANKKRIATSVAAVATAAALLLGGTFAWQGINQTALNEASDVINPGGRLHDDFSYTEEIKNKDVYVENFADEAIFARVRLEEYFGITMNKGVEGAEKTENIVGDKNEDGTYNYVVFTGYDSLTDGDVSAGGTDAEENPYWTWTTGGETVYMPTFNLDKDSLQADINGTYDYVDPDTDENDPYGDYVDWSTFLGENDVEGVGATKTANEIYDADTNNVDDDGTTTVDNVTHTAKYTDYAELISMSDWLEKLYETDDGEGNYDAGALDNYWVYDADGWVYYSKAIPGRNDDGTTNATGLLLDGIKLNQVMDDSWYYAINVVGQFVTADDVGKSDNTGFYTDGAPSAEAEELLSAIGVDMSGEAATPDDGDEDEGDEGDQYVPFNIVNNISDNKWDDVIYMSADAFASDGTGNGLQLMTFYGDTSENGYASDVEWSLESLDDKSYTANESADEYSVYTIKSDKTVDEIAAGETFMFRVTASDNQYPDNPFSSEYTVIIGEESPLTMTVDMKDPELYDWIYPTVTITSSTDPNFNYNHENDYSYIDITFYTDDTRTVEADTNQIRYDSSDCSYYIDAEGTYYYTATYTNGELTASCEGVVECVKPEVDFDLSVDYDSELVSYDAATNTYTMSKAGTGTWGDTTIEFTLTGKTGEEDVGVSIYGEAKMDGTPYVRDTTFDGASETGFTYYIDADGNTVCCVTQGENGEDSPDASLVGENLYNVSLYPTNSSFSVSFTYYYGSFEYDTVTVNFVVDIAE